MGKQKKNGVLNRLAGKKVVFSGRFDWGQEERLKLLAKAHGGAVPDDLDASADYLILRDLTAGKTIQAKAQKLNARGASIQTIDAETFERTFTPTDAEIIELIRSGPEAAEAIGIVTSGRRGFYSTTPPQRTITGEKFDGADLTGFHFTDVAFDQCSFKGATLQDTIFSSATHCDFEGAKGKTVHFESVSQSRFAKAELSDVTIHGALDDLDLSSATMPNLVLWGRMFMGTHRHPSSKMTGGMKFTRGSFPGAKLQQDGKLASPDFEGADLSKSIMPSCEMDAPNFRGAKLIDAVLTETKLPNADFSGANLTGAELAGADLTGASFDGADLTRCNLRDAKLDGVDLAKAKNYSPAAAIVGTIGPALTELDTVAANARRIQIEFRVRREGDDGEGEPVGLDTSGMQYGWGLTVPPEFHFQMHSRRSGPRICSDSMIDLAKLLGHWKVRYETLDVSSTKASLSGKALRELVMKGIAEAFTQPIPPEDELAAATKAYREKVKESTAAQREQREKARQQAVKEQEKAKKQIAKKIEKEVGKVTDTATFLKALELRIEPEKIKKATKMLKASKFQLYNDVTNSYTSGVVKSQTDPDLVYACRINDDGTYSCCTQNLNVCGGLRGSICKHLLVLIIGLVNANQLDPVTIDEWVAKSQNSKPVLDKEKMGDIFIKYKGAEAGEIDWRPTETLPEDYYAL